MESSRPALILGSQYHVPLTILGKWSDIPHNCPEIRASSSIIIRVDQGDHSSCNCYISIRHFNLISKLILSGVYRRWSSELFWTSSETLGEQTGRGRRCRQVICPPAWLAEKLRFYDVIIFSLRSEMNNHLTNWACFSILKYFSKLYRIVVANQLKQWMAVFLTYLIIFKTLS